MPAGLGPTLLIGGGEAVLVWLWRQGTQCVAQFGAAENPYAADAGLFAVLLLPLFALALCWAIYGTGRWKDD